MLDVITVVASYKVLRQVQNCCCKLVGVIQTVVVKKELDGFQYYLGFCFWQSPSMG